MLASISNPYFGDKSNHETYLPARETKTFCSQGSVCLKDTKDSTISNELQIFLIHSPTAIIIVT